MTRIYTRGGDAGDTSLADGSRTSKAEVRVGLYGEVDELNSWLGYCAAIARPAGLDDLATELAGIQDDLLQLGGILADPRRCAALAGAGAGDFPFAAERLEGLIDRLDANLEPLRSFLRPGGQPTAAALHVARSVCRRLERRAVSVADAVSLPGPVLAYLNRLSDFLFVAARWANHRRGGEDEIWSGSAPASPEPPERGS